MLMPFHMLEESGVLFLVQSLRGFWQMQFLPQVQDSYILHVVTPGNFKFWTRYGKSIWQKLFWVKYRHFAATVDRQIL